MAQAYLTDTGFLFFDDPTKTEIEIESLSWFDNNIMATSDVSDEVFDLAKIYFYVESLDWYFEAFCNCHPYIVASSGLFTSERWAVIEVYVQQYGLNYILQEGRFDDYEPRLNYLVSLSLITSDEKTLLLSVLPTPPV